MRNATGVGGQGMISMLYVSTAVQPFPATEIAVILHKARETNARLGVTGMLLFKGQQFMQLIEGDADHVAALYVRIAADTRHNGVKLMLNGPITTRQFPAWSMAFRAVTDESLSRIPGYDDFLDPSRGIEKTWQDPSRAQWLLDWFRLRTA